MVQKNKYYINYGYVYKITFPNGKIYIGSDTAKQAEYDYYKYIGTPCLKARKLMHDDMINQFDCKKTLIIKKELLYEAHNCTVTHIKEKEREFIRALNATNKIIGYNMK